MFFPIGRMNSHPALTGLDDVTLTRLAAPACNAVENFCNRKLQVATYDELYPATRSRFLFLNQYPVTQIMAVRAVQTPVMQVSNTTANIEAATATIGQTGLTLTTISNAVSTPVTLTWAAYPTVGQLVTAISTAGNGWSATVSGPFGSGWSSADLAVYRATYSARQTTVSISTHYHPVSGYQVNPASGELVTAGGWNGSGLWPFRISYTAGYDPVPDELVQATIELAASTFKASKIDVNMQSESLGGYSYTRAASKSIADLSIQTQQVLHYYRKPRVPYFGVY